MRRDEWRLFTPREISRWNQDRRLREGMWGCCYCEAGHAGKTAGAAAGKASGAGGAGGAGDAGGDGGVGSGGECHGAGGVSCCTADETGKTPKEMWRILGDKKWSTFAANSGGWRCQCAQVVGGTKRKRKKKKKVAGKAGQAGEGEEKAGGAGTN